MCTYACFNLKFVLSRFGLRISLPDSEISLNEPERNVEEVEVLVSTRFPPRRWYLWCTRANRNVARLNQKAQSPWEDENEWISCTAFFSIECFGFLARLNLRVLFLWLRASLKLQDSTIARVTHPNYSRTFNFNMEINDMKFSITVFESCGYA